MIVAVHDLGFSERAGLRAGLVRATGRTAPAFPGTP